MQEDQKTDFQVEEFGQEEDCSLRKPKNAKMIRIIVIVVGAVILLLSIKLWLDLQSSSDIDYLHPNPPIVYPTPPRPPLEGYKLITREEVNFGDLESGLYKAEGFVESIRRFVCELCLSDSNDCLPCPGPEIIFSEEMEREDKHDDSSVLVIAGDISECLQNKKIMIPFRLDYDGDGKMKLTYRDSDRYQQLADYRNQLPKSGSMCSSECEKYVYDNCPSSCTKGIDPCGSEYSGKLRNKEDVGGECLCLNDPFLKYKEYRFGDIENYCQGQGQEQDFSLCLSEYEELCAKTGGIAKSGILVNAYEGIGVTKTSLPIKCICEDDNKKWTFEDGCIDSPDELLAVEISGELFKADEGYEIELSPFFFRNQKEPNVKASKRKNGEAKIVLLKKKQVKKIVYSSLKEATVDSYGNFSQTIAGIDFYPDEIAVYYRGEEVSRVKALAKEAFEVGRFISYLKQEEGSNEIISRWRVLSGENLNYGILVNFPNYKKFLTKDNKLIWEDDKLTIKLEKFDSDYFGKGSVTLYATNGFETKIVGSATLDIKHQSVKKTAAPIKQKQEEKHCIDEDGGFDYYKKASTTGRGSYSFYGRWYTHEDSCYKDANPNNGLDNQLHEQYCGDDDRVLSRSYQCPDGCEDGACVGERVSVWDTKDMKTKLAKRWGGILMHRNQYLVRLINNYNFDGETKKIVDKDGAIKVVHDFIKEYYLILSINEPTSEYYEITGASILEEGASLTEKYMIKVDHIYKGLPVYWNVGILFYVDQLGYVNSVSNIMDYGVSVSDIQPRISINEVKNILEKNNYIKDSLTSEGNLGIYNNRLIWHFKYHKGLQYLGLFIDAKTGEIKYREDLAH